MNATRRHNVRMLAAGTAAAVVLGTATTAVLATVGVLPGPSTSPAPSGARCQVPRLPGAVVDVTLTDMGGMRGHPNGPGPPTGDHQQWPRRGPRGMMRMFATPDAIPQGTVSLRAVNTGAWTHELVVMPLPAGQRAGQRPIGADGKIDETGSLGEASRVCASGSGDGITAGATGWTTLTLKPGRYELMCNLPGHYAAGMYTELDVTG
ncbi:MAG: sulfocyanin-like copper-binding protein [Actinomadura sp.]